MRKKLLLAFFSALVCFCQAAKNAKFELPGNIIPLSYRLEIATLFEAKKFDGKVEIRVRCDKNTNEVILNVDKNLKIDDKSVKIESLEKSDPEVVIGNLKKIEDEERYVISLSTELIDGKLYEIHINYMGSFSFAFLAYQMGSFVNNEDNSQNFVAFTRLGIGYARGLFPCFDTMAFKAKFKIIHQHQADVIGFSNMMPESTALYEKISQKWVTDVFEETPPMSTHTVGLALANLVEKTTKLDSEKSISIWSTELLQSRIDFASDMAAKILKFYSHYLQVCYPLKRLNIIAMPLYLGNNEEEMFGMIVGREETIITDENETAERKNEIVRKLCLTCGRQWFGGYTTMSQTNEYWIHQSLVIYLQDLCLEQTFPSERSKDYEHFLFSMFTDVLENDLETSASSDNLYENVELTYNYPDSWISEKTHLLVFMLKFIFGKELFQKSLRNYVTSFAYKNSSLKDIWKIFTNAAENEGILPVDTTVEQIMDSWMTQSMYPVINVNRNYKTNEVSISQEAFVMFREGRKTNPTEKCWLTPLSFTSKNEKTMSDKVRGWSLCKKEKISLNDYYQSLSEDTWILFHSKLYGLYQTNYDDRNWKLLQDALKRNEFGPMDELTRSRLLFDIFMLAKAGKQNYGFVLETMQYLIHETSHFVWQVVEGKLEKIHRALFRTELYEDYQNYIGKILTEVFEKMDMDSINDLDQFHDPDDYDTSVKLLVFNLACSFGVEKCKEQSLLLFKKWCDNYDNEKVTKLIPDEILETVFCAAVKRNDENWKLLREKYKLGNGEQVNQKLLKGLGCSENEETLEEYALKILTAERCESKLDDLVIFESLTLNKISYNSMKKLLIDGHKEFIEFFAEFPNTNLDTGIEILLNATTRQFDLEEIKSLMKKVQEEINYVTLMNEKVVEAERHIKWFAKNKGTFSEFLSSKTVRDMEKKDDKDDGEDEIVELGQMEEADELDETDKKDEK